MGKTTPLFSKIDESFSESGLLNYDIVLLVDGNSCAYSIFDHGNNRFIAIESYRIPLPELIGQLQWLTSPARSLKIIIENSRSTLIPSPLFEESEKNSLLNFSLEPEEDEKVLIDRLTQLEMVNIFGVNNLLYDQLTKFFPGAQICHVSSVLIESIWMNFKNLIADKRIFIYVREAAFNMLIFDKKQLVFSNSFHFMTPEDLIYFVIFVMEQSDLNPEEVPVTLLGAIDVKTPHYDLIFRYIRNVEFGSRNESTGFSYVFDDVPGHYFYPLLNPVLCGS
jgi:hypothetical protein